MVEKGENIASSVFCFVSNENSINTKEILKLE